MIHAETAALGDLSGVLAEIFTRSTTVRQSLRRAISDCHKIHQLVLDKPMLEPRLSGDLEMICFPSSIAGYINPNFRVTQTRRSDEGQFLARDDVWRTRTLRQGLGGFLAGYLRTADATERPLVVLGDPGSGKSLLSKILAARLPPDEFAVVRVELRHVRSTSDISDQIDQELQRQTNNRYRLQDLTDDRGQVTRVIIMDGLDELLQLSSREGLGRYLELLTEFQEVEGALGHPVIAIATARTIVMDRIYVPNRSVVVKLEDFSQDQILSWLRAWNLRNVNYFTRFQLQELAPDSLLRQNHLARQPLLLALLALYDAESNALRDASNLSQAELYERIFHRYLERELEKSDLPARKGEQEQLIEQRFRELSTIAIGMMNRGRRFITRAEVIEDFSTTGIKRLSSVGTELTGADDAVGQFFFLYRAQALQDAATVGEGYEFIHATFGEFLAARIIARQLARASDVIDKAPAWDRSEAERHARSLLVPFLARRPFIGEEQVLSYLEDIMGSLVGNRRKAASAISCHIPTLLKIGIPEISGYVSKRGQLDQLATLTVNLLVAALRTAKEALPLSALCGSSQDSMTQWRRLTTLWQAYLAIDDWDQVLSSLLLTPDASGVELSAPHDLRRTEDSIGVEIRDPHVRRLIKTGRLTDDFHLRASATVWNYNMAVFFSDAYESLDVVEGRSEWLLAAAYFRMSPEDVSRPSIASGLALFDAIGGDAAYAAVGGPSRWSDEQLSEIANYLIKVGRPVDDVRGLLEIVLELDRRKVPSLARKLLRLFPGDAVAAVILPADAASIIGLSRRHQIPELISRCTNPNWLSDEILEWLNIEDISWIIESRSMHARALDSLRRRLRSEVRYRRAVEEANGIINEDS
jgi:type II secretory pathway predicted ATPase ExeA